MSVFTKLREWLGPVFPFIIVGVICLVAGRYLAPTKVEVREVEREKTVVVEKINEKKLEELTLQIRTTLASFEQLKKSIHKEKTKTTHPDGRVEEKEVVDINVDRTVQTTQVKEVEKQVVVVQERLVDRIVEVDRVVEKEKIVETKRPDWRVGVLAGPNLTDFKEGLKIVGGVEIQRRLFGPIYVGGFGMSNGVVGLSAGVEF